MSKGGRGDTRQKQDELGVGGTYHGNAGRQAVYAEDRQDAEGKEDRGDYLGQKRRAYIAPASLEGAPTALGDLRGWAEEHIRAWSSARDLIGVG